MAKINEQALTIKLSKLMRDSDTPDEILTDEDLATLIEALKSMVGDSVLIELE
jgi:hypothetical protein